MPETAVKDPRGAHMRTENPVGQAYINEVKCLKMIKLDGSGVIEYRAWSNMRFVNVWERSRTPTKSDPYMVFLDCPTARQITYRLFICEGHTMPPEDEKWTLMTFVWSTKRSFATLWMSTSCYKRTDQPKRGVTPARLVEVINMPKE